MDGKAAQVRMLASAGLSVAFIAFVVTQFAPADMVVGLSAYIGQVKVAGSQQGTCAAVVETSKALRKLVCLASIQAGSWEGIHKSRVFVLGSEVSTLAA